MGETKEQLQAEIADLKRQLHGKVDAGEVMSVLEGVRTLLEEVFRDKIRLEATAKRSAVVLDEISERGFAPIDRALDWLRHS